MSKSRWSRVRHHRNTAFKKYMKTASKKAWKQYMRFERMRAS